ncbi:MAG TPA: FadR/GntR family transcriptional regulator [Methylomirabilota bacterium]|nr:FadR/GntR family transcriptional regulator [Methylomirabilota bacterium]
MPIEIIVQRRLYRQVADQLRHLFDAGEYTVGDRLPSERDLAERMGVSRPTIREALIALEVEGRVRIRVGSGIYVTEPPAAAPQADADEGPFELLRAREFVEGAVAEEAARHADADHIQRLDEILAEMDGRDLPSRQSIDLDRSFHVGVASILGNSALSRVVADLFDQRMNPYFERLSSYFEDRNTWKAATAEHHAIRDAIVSGDPERARAAMQNHLRQSQLRFSQSFGEISADGEAPGLETAVGGSSG